MPNVREYTEKKASIKAGQIEVSPECVKHSERCLLGKVTISSAVRDAVESRLLSAKEAYHALDTGADGRCDGPRYA